jgi:predicted CoA-substrate-specific enzyme activase
MALILIKSLFMFRIGLDVGSTTAKIVVINENGDLVYTSYRRHLANVKGAIEAFLNELKSTLTTEKFTLSITGSVGLGVSERYNIPFVQEVIAASEFTKKVHPEISTIIDIGGEDAKIVYLNDGQVSDLRMNGNCAGGTGAFIDQMALCLGVEVTDLDGLAKNAQHIYPIASRCGVFSKTDIQNLIARNVSKEDIAASIFRAVAVQTASALSHGCEVRPKVLFCGGPLTFIGSLRKAVADYFHLDLEKDCVVLDNANIIPAWGTALFKNDMQPIDVKELEEILSKEPVQTTEVNPNKNKTNVDLPPIFNDEEEFLAWKSEKEKMHIPVVNLNEYKGKAYLGIDSGSTTTKIVVINDEGDIL